MIGEFIIIILGLIIFEIVSSVDNAVINAHILKTMPTRFRRIFLFWGILFAVFVVRGILPFIIVWMANPALNFTEVFHVAFSQSPQILQYAEQSKPVLILAGGVYLFLIFLSWLFLEEKKYAFIVEKFIHKQSMWFYALASIFLTVLIFICVKVKPILALSATIGATAFFITDGFKKNAEEKEKQLLSSNVSAWSKILYLEVLDMSFSIDGVIGAFAFTTSVLLILIGNGIGAFIVRDLTVRGIDKITKYAYLKNGAMYSIGVLGFIMVMESFGNQIPFWIAPVNMFVILGIFLYLSYIEIKQGEKEGKIDEKTLEIKKENLNKK
jgi:hypothetical protein